jgi:hypothetical protein
LLTHAHAIGTQGQAEAMCSLALFLSRTSQGEILNESLPNISASTYTNRSYLSDVLFRQMRLLPADTFTRFLRALWKSNNTDARNWSISALADQIPGEALPEALSIARTIQNDWEQSRIVCELAPRLISEIVAGNDAATSTWPKPGAKSLLAIFRKKEGAKPSLLNQALAVARSINNPAPRAQALISLIAELPIELRSSFVKETLNTIKTIKDADHLVKSLLDLADYLPPKSRRQLLAQALQAIRATNNHWLRGKLLSQIVSYLPHELQAAVSEESLASMLRVTDESNQIENAGALLPFLPVASIPGIIPLIGKGAGIIRHQAHLKVLILISNTPRADLQGEYFRATSAAVETIEDRGTQATVLPIMAYCVPVDDRQVLVEKALALSRAIEEPRQRAEIMIFLVKGLLSVIDPKFIEEALSATYQVEDLFQRTAFLLELQEYLSIQDRKEVLRVLLGQHIYQIFPGSVLAEFILNWQQLGFTGLEEPADQATIWQGLATNSRDEFLEKVADLAPLLAYLGGQALVQETTHIIKDVLQQWP